MKSANITKSSQEDKSFSRDNHFFSSKIKSNKRCLRADSLSLLLSALRPRLLSSNNKTMQTIFSGHTRSRLAKLIAPKKCLHIFEMLAVTVFTFFLTQNAYVNKVNAASLTLSIPNTISLNINPSSSGTFTKSEASTFSVKSDASFGYTLNIKSKGSTNDLTNGSSKITSISSVVSETDFSFKGTNNTWGYLPSKLKSSNNSSFQPVPTTSGSLIDKTSSPNVSAANNYNITLAAKVDTTIPNGNYTNTFVLTAVANTIQYKIKYDFGQLSSDGGVSWNGKSPQIGSTTGSSVQLDSNTPDHWSYSFNGWCTVQPSGETCPEGGTLYKPGDSFPLSSSSSEVTLYAVWSAKCFVTGTLIDTPDGLKPIEELEIGDKIYSYDFETQERAIDTVTSVPHHENKNTIKVTMDDGSIIQGTPQHLFYNWKEEGWDPLQWFEPGYTIHNSAGEEQIIKTQEIVNDEQTVYNIETQNFHNFYVATSENNKFLVLGVLPPEIKRQLLENNYMPLIWGC